MTEDELNTLRRITPWYLEGQKPVSRAETMARAAILDKLLSEGGWSTLRDGGETMAPMNPGDYSVRTHPETGEPMRSGVCAACQTRVEEDEPSVVTYPHGKPEGSIRGGIFHSACDISDASWYTIGPD